ncbi:MAG: pyridoxal phosphate-dependent aminotransferase [Acidobacteriota bacterium]|nr:pyridoxal phosphate-dependent aminotransferase [Acidobacteriota bacterium]
MPVRFSERTGWDTGESRLTAAIRSARSSGRPLLDLTVSNPTLCGFHYDKAEILAPLSSPSALVYDPDPKGVLSARQAVCNYYADHRASIQPRQLMLTTSTSEAYSYLFRLLCDAGDEVLVAQPSYPLFDFLADLENVRLRPYRLFYDYGWWIDFAALEQSIGPRTRAILVVHPNNPTGHATRRAERQRLEQLCVQHSLALIVDEVFLDYPIGEVEALESFAVGPHPALTFCLSGISKIAGLPQMKVGWIVCAGPEALQQAALARLEVIADTFLSMNAPAQAALPAWLARRHGIQRQIRERVEANLAVLRSAGLEVMHLEAGWCGVLRVPRDRWAEGGSEDLALQLLLDSDVVVHPGSFYGMAEPGRLVVSLLVEPHILEQAARRIRYSGRNHGS